MDDGYVSRVVRNLVLAEIIDSEDLDDSYVPSEMETLQNRIDLAC